MPNVVPKKSFIEFLEKQEGEYIVLGNFIKGKLTPKSQYTESEITSFVPAVFDKPDMNILMKSKLIIIAKKESLSGEIQKQIDDYNKTLSKD